MKRLVAAIALLAPLAAMGADPDLGDRRLAVIDDPLRVELQGAAGLTKEKIRQTIAVVAPSRDWKVLAEADGRLELTRTANNRHVMRIELTYDLPGYAIRYLDSSTLMYRELRQSGVQIRAIHRSYNTWIRELASAINESLGVSASLMATKLLAIPPLPEQINIVAPAPDVPAAAAAFSGAWGGRWGSELDHVLIVERIDGRNAAFVYSWASSTQEHRGSTRNAKAYVVPSWGALVDGPTGFMRGTGVAGSDGVLRATLQNGASLAYRLSDDRRTLIGEYSRNGQVTHGSFDKMDDGKISGRIR